MPNKGSFNINTGNFTYKIPEKPKIGGISEIGEIPLKEPLFDNIGQERIDSLKKSISEIKQLIKEREKLSKEVVQECERLKTEINNFLLENENIELTEHDALLERNNLRAKKISVSELQLNEKIDAWKDIGILKKELREYEQELSEKENRIKALNEILEAS